MMEKGPNQKSVDIFPTTFQNDDLKHAQLENKGNMLVALHTKYPLHYIVYPIS